MAAENLDEVLANLLENARVHGGPGTAVRIEALPGGEVFVSDDGPGISEANASRIFTPFFTTARDRGGSGLGLSIVRSLLEAHGGSIELEPGGPGARFRIRIPIAA